MVVFELPREHPTGSAGITSDLSYALLTISQQIADRSIYGFNTDALTQLISRREDLCQLYDAIIRQRACEHTYND
jgi:hypothetical protein